MNKNPHKQRRIERGICLDCAKPATAGKQKCQTCLDTRARDAAERHQRYLDFIREQKAKPCVDCGVEYPHYVMDFDHVRGEKTREVSRMVNCSLDAIRAEIEKCDLVCANCHRIRTQERL